MPGNNHYADCLCGWCVKERYERQITKPLFMRTRFETYESFVNPNAVCPECGAQVFFYQSPYGGKVYFDELGPPWPKHPCTDHLSRSGTKLAAKFVVPVAQSRKEASWKTSNWQPISVVRVYQEDDWWVLRAEILEGKLFIRLLLESKPTLRYGMIAHFSGWDESGYAAISYLDEAEVIDVIEIPTYKYAEYVFTPCGQAMSQRQKLGKID